MTVSGGRDGHRPGVWMKLLAKELPHLGMWTHASGRALSSSVVALPEKTRGFARWARTWSSWTEAALSSSRNAAPAAPARGAAALLAGKGSTVNATRSRATAWTTMAPG
eukprot:CAMPEP_0197944014 /NCGR_PEP_ID=MMETSP1439-20131203/125199_1 /TAXON_ID=66791 /ORGANISM="Gonyaulax spinifera, Strain CCMP409" /LENGTH=108 /DNA_ID=CAMNT_0043567269 /DNA_START=869 /DNA_END=1195 /DNA_ORIENTATION=-